MCYIILPRPELIYYVQHRRYAPIGAIDYTATCLEKMKKRNLSILPKFFKWNIHMELTCSSLLDIAANLVVGFIIQKRDMAAALILHVGSAKKRAFVCCLVDEVAER